MEEFDIGWNETKSGILYPRAWRISLLLLQNTYKDLKKKINSSRIFAWH